MNGAEAQIDWVSAGGVLLAGVIVGAIVMFFIRRRGAAAPVSSTPSTLRSDLNARYESLIAQLREVDPADTGERDRLEREAADVLRRLDAAPPEAQSAPAVASAAPQQAAKPQGSSATAGFVWGAASMAVLAGLIIFVMRATEEREQAPQPAAQATTTDPHAGGAPNNDPQMNVLRGRITVNPEDLEARLELARLSLVGDDLMETYRQTEYVLQRQPEHPQALTYNAFVRMAMGQFEDAETMLKKSTAIDPTLLDSWVQLALLYTETDRPAEAQKAMDEAIRQQPAHADALRGLFAQMKDGSTGAPSMPAAASPQPSVAPSGEGVAGTIELAGGVTVPPGALLFITARAAGVTAGPPVAVVRLPVSSFPVTFELTQANSMMGQPLPQNMRIEARLDSDGDPLSRTPSDPAVAMDGIATGRRDLKLVLSR